MIHTQSSAGVLARVNSYSPIRSNHDSPVLAAGRRDSPGRPLNWATTPAFLAHFGLDDLTELPGLDELRAAGLLDLGPAVLAETAAEPEGAVEPAAEEE